MHFHISLKSFFSKEGHLGDSVGWVSGFGSGDDITVLDMSHVGLTAISAEPALDPLSPLSLYFPCSLALT